MLGSCVIISLVYWHTANYAFGLVLDPYVALDKNSVGTVILRAGRYFLILGSHTIGIEPSLDMSTKISILG